MHKTAGCSSPLLKDKKRKKSVSFDLGAWESSIFFLIYWKSLMFSFFHLIYYNQQWFDNKYNKSSEMQKINKNKCEMNVWF